jgi:endoglucanase
MKEPHEVPNSELVAAENAAIAAIRGTGATQLIFVASNDWEGGVSWNNNATALANITDPNNNFVFAIHQYLGANSGGMGTDCVVTTVRSQRLPGFATWLRGHGKKGFGENFTCWEILSLEVLSSTTTVRVQRVRRRSQVNSGV